MVDGDHSPGLGRRLGDAAAAVDVDRERLLDEHVPPGSEGLNGERGVRPRGCGDDDHVDVAIGEEPVEVRFDRGRRVAGGEAHGEVLLRVGDAGQLGGRELGDGTGEKRAERPAPEESEPVRRTFTRAHVRVRSRSAAPMLLSAMP